MYRAPVFADQHDLLMVVTLAHTCVAREVVGMLVVSLDFALAVRQWNS